MPNFFNMNTSEILEPQDWGFPVPISYGPGRISEIGKNCGELNIKKPLIVTDRGSKDLPFIKSIQNFLEKSNIQSDLYFEISPNPKEDEITGGCNVFKDGNHDAIIAIGGGSAMDGGKACLLYTSPSPRDEL